MKKKRTLKKDETDWTRVDSMTDADIDLSECPEVTPEMFARAVVRHGLKPVGRKSQLTLRVDADVLAWFRASGSGYQTRINTLLREYVRARLDQIVKSLGEADWPARVASREAHIVDDDRRVRREVNRAA